MLAETLIPSNWISKLAYRWLCKYYHLEFGKIFYKRKGVITGELEYADMPIQLLVVIIFPKIFHLKKWSLLFVYTNM